MRIIFPLFCFIISFVFSFSQGTEITIHNKGSYVSQTGKLVEGYKEGEWINVDRRNDTTFSIYKKDRLIFQKKFAKKTYGKYKGSTITESISYNYNKYTKSQFKLNIAENQVYGLEKNVTCPYYSKPYFKYYITGDSRNIKTIIQTLNLSMSLYPLKSFYGTEYDRDLKPLIPMYGKLDFVTNDETGNRKIEKVNISYGGERIEQKKYGEIIRFKENSYEILVTDSYFFLEKSGIMLKKNGNVVFEQTFLNGLPESYNSFYDNGTSRVILNYKDGLPHGEFRSFYEDGKLMVSCFFEDGILQGNFEKYKKDGTLKFTAPFVNGELDGIVSGENQEIYYRNRVIQQLIKRDEFNKVIKWTSGYNFVSTERNRTETKIDGVKHTVNDETGKYTEFFYGIGDYHFRYGDYPTQKMMIINLHKDKNNWCSFYINEDQEVKDDINVTVDGVNYRKKSKKVKLKLINKNFMRTKRLRFPNFLTTSETRIGDTLIRNTFFPNGEKCLEEKLVDGKFSGTRKVWSYSGDLLQVSNYKNNHNEGLFTNYSIAGEVIEQGSYKVGIKNGVWKKNENGVYFEYNHDFDNTANVIKSFYDNGDIKSIYTKLDSGNVSEEFNENGTRKKLTIRNFKNKLHGEYFTTFKEKTYSGSYLNGYRNGLLKSYDEKGNLESTQNYEYGRLMNNPTKAELNATCNCPQEFNTRNGSSFYPGMKDFISYAEFSLFFKDLLSISEKDYRSSFARNFQNSYSRDNVSRFYGFDMINFSPKKVFKLLPYKDLELLFTPCLKSGETGFRSITINTEKPLERYSYEFDTEKEFIMTSENVYKLLLEMSNQNTEEFLESAFYNKDELDELTKYLNKKGLKIPYEKELEKQIADLANYLDENDKVDEFYDFLFKKEFDHGDLYKNINKKAREKFNESIRKYFYYSSRVKDIETLERDLFTTEASLQLDGGRYGIQHPLLRVNDQNSILYFNCKSIDVNKKITVQSITNICIEPNTIISGTDFTIEKITDVKFNHQSSGGGVKFECNGFFDKIRKSINFKLVFSKNEILGYIQTNQFSENQINKVLKQTKGSLISNGNTIRFVID